MAIIAHARAVAAIAAIALTCLAVHLAQPALLGAFALAGAAVVALAPDTSRRLDVIALAAVWAMFATMFGLAGAGCFILAHVLTICVVRAIETFARPSDAFLTTCVVAACGAPLLDMTLAAHWPVTGSLIVLLALAAPGFALQRLVAAVRDHDCDTDERHLALIPLLAGLAIGGALDGIRGAAAVFVVFALAMPLFSLLAPGALRALRLSLAVHALGVMASALVACIATAVALAFADGRYAAMGPAAAIGMLAGYSVLRVHAPAAAGRLVRGRGAVVEPPIVAPSLTQP